MRELELVLFEVHEVEKDEGRVFLLGPSDEEAEAKVDALVCRVAFGRAHLHRTTNQPTQCAQA